MKPSQFHSLQPQVGDNTANLWGQRPFRAPHHTASAVAMVGGGTRPKPGEISLAHGGVLFLDELPEFDRKVLEVLREPLEAGTITIARAANHVHFPAQFQLIAAMNPCPCGYAGHPNNKCQCSVEQVKRYQNKISGPLLDRIDMRLVVPAISATVLNELTELQKNQLTENSEQVKTRVMKSVEFLLGVTKKIFLMLTCLLNSYENFAN